MADELKRGYLRPRFVEGYDTAIDRMSDRISELEAEIERLRAREQDLRMHAEQDACEIERLRAAGDQLAYHVRAENAKEMYTAVRKWQEARHG